MDLKLIIVTSVWHAGVIGRKNQASTINEASLDYQASLRPISSSSCTSEEKTGNFHQVRGMTDSRNCQFDSNQDDTMRYSGVFMSVRHDEWRNERTFSASCNLLVVRMNTFSFKRKRISSFILNWLPIGCFLLTCKNIFWLLVSREYLSIQFFRWMVRGSLLKEVNLTWEE